jgi:hypothetical protein
MIVLQILIFVILGRNAARLKVTVPLENAVLRAMLDAVIIKISPAQEVQMSVIWIVIVQLLLVQQQRLVAAVVLVEILC